MPLQDNKPIPKCLKGRLGIRFEGPGGEGLPRITKVSLEGNSVIYISTLATLGILFGLWGLVV